MKIKLGFLVILVWLLSACQQNNHPSQISTETSLFTKTIADLPAPSALPPYEELYQSYLQSKEIVGSGRQWQEFEKTASATDIAQCAQLPWQQQLSANFWSLSFYRLATNCFDHHADSERLKLFNAYQQYHLQGILSTGNGQSAAAAYRINSFADAHEVLRHLGMETQDFFAELNANGSALYYVVQAYDANDNKFKKFYFQNQPYLYALEQYPYPFIGLVNGWNRILLPEFAKANPMLGLPLAQVAVSEKRYDDAITLYRNAIAEDSLQARVELVEMCYLAKTPLKPKDCYNELLEAADRDYVPALELLLFLHHKGLIANTSDKLQTDLLETINEMTQSGHAELALSRQYFSQSFEMRDTEAAINWLNKAVAKGNQQAGFYQLIWLTEQKKISPEAAFLQFKQLAANGSSEAAYRTASYILQQEKPTADDIQLAHTLLLQAKLDFHPEADFLLALGYQSGLFTKPAGTDNAVIFQLYQNAAQKFVVRAMNRLGEIYLEGTLTEKNPVKANNWFLLCARLNSPTCAFNAAVMLDNGDGVEVNYEDAFNLFRFAAEHGHPGAMNRLGLMYLYGKGVAADTKKGLQLLEAAANRGSENSRLYLGIIYLEGKFVSQNLALAKSHLAQLPNHPEALKYLQNWDFYVQKLQKAK